MKQKVHFTRLQPFESPWYWPGGHLQTIGPSYFRKVASFAMPLSSECATPDGDVLYYDWYQQAGAAPWAVVCHGLEGHSKRPYVLGMARCFWEAGYQVVAWNYRSCGGRMNKQLRFYHSGATDDLAVLLAHLREHAAQPVVLVGFSLGGNLCLRLLGELAHHTPHWLKAGVAISAPIDLAAGADYLARGANMFYTRHFLKSLKAKVLQKATQFPGQLPVEALQHVKTLRDFDDQFTGPLHGYADAADYYARASALFVLEQIQVPALLLQAENDPFLPPSCYPQPHNALVHTHYVNQGGHVGFVQNKRRYSYAEQVTIDFLNKL